MKLVNLYDEMIEAGYHDTDGAYDINTVKNTVIDIDCYDVCEVSHVYDRVEVLNPNCTWIRSDQITVSGPDSFVCRSKLW